MAQAVPEVREPRRITADKESANWNPPRPNCLPAAVPINRIGCFESDRVIKSGYVQKRTQKTKAWKPIFLVLRHQTLSIYKNDKETKLRHQLYLSDLTAVAYLKDPKQKREHVFGLFSPSKNFHLQAPTQAEAREWVELIRKNARIEEEEEEMLLASPVTRPQPPPLTRGPGPGLGQAERVLSSSPEQYDLSSSHSGFMAFQGRRQSSYMEYSGQSGNELASHSDFSDNDVHRVQGVSLENLAVQTPANLPQQPRTLSQTSVPAVPEQDLDRVVWQGWLWFLRSKGGVRQWKHMWGVLRPRNFILYKDESEYTAQRILPLPSVVNVVDIDPLSKHKTHCLQVITEEKSYRFCAPNEDALVRCIGAFKSLLAKRREAQARAAAASHS
ncbi:hypothetical protein S40285_00385 [Stachybotrys chlorohalonatus IBT 40285]|uniref:PH domain-containing protein n=1 Tax=Stachybotrys chlorohalonatus (strain IBT 40285) TaxID=1283841 RepID=A0A084QHT6_STAC4|nr:hypothetical protein S40285_00385 [Stachybotrys chlorohalonata IBT 40285]